MWLGVLRALFTCGLLDCPMFKRQQGQSLLSLLLGLILSLGLMTVWQRVLTQTHLNKGVMQQQSQRQAELAWLQSQLLQDFKAQPQGPCVVLPDQAMVFSEQSLTLIPELLRTPVLASHGFGPLEAHTLTHIRVAASVPLTAYLAAPDEYIWHVSRCDVAWAFSPKNWTIQGEQVQMVLPEGWPLGVHVPGRPQLLHLSVSERVHYELTQAGVMRSRLARPDLEGTLVSRLNVFQLKAWQRQNCEVWSKFKAMPMTTSVMSHDLVMHELVLGWRGVEQIPDFVVGVALVPVSGFELNRGCGPWGI